MKSKLLINGKWKDSGLSEEVHDKFSLEPFSEMCLASSEDVDEAISGAEVAYRKIQLSPYERYEVLLKAAEIVKSRRTEFMELMIRESGFTLLDCDNELNRTEQTLRICAEEAKRITGDIVPMDAAPGVKNRFGFTIRVPRGVVCAITPFNSPFNTVAHKIGPAIAAGNSVVLKPAGYTPLCAVKLCEVLLEAGLPPELISLVHGPGSVVGRILLADKRVAFYTFTGSTNVGLEIQGAARLRGTSLELGSIATTIICDDADLDIAVSKTLNAAFRKAGQVCTSTQRILVDERIQDVFVEKFLSKTRGLKFGNPKEPDTVVGPMISSFEKDRASSWINEAVAQGAVVLAGGGCEANVLAPTVMTNVNASMRVVGEEVFAPVVSLIPYGELDSAFEVANSTPYGLSVGVFTKDLSRALHAAPNLQFGTIHINEPSSSRVDQMPFGGVKDSGYGHEGPYYAIREMTEERLVTISY